MPEQTPTHLENSDRMLSTKQLLIACVAAVALSATVLLVLILPAEFQLDPTGLGQRIGLMQLSRPLTQSDSNEVQANTHRTERVRLELQPGQGLEYKLEMKTGARVNYSWKTRGGSLYSDLHGEPEGDITGYYESYTVGTSEALKGAFTAPFNGSHGWYWHNRSKTAVKVTLILEGEFGLIGVK